MAEVSRGSGGDRDRVKVDACLAKPPVQGPGADDPAHERRVGPWMHEVEALEQREPAALNRSIAGD